jgi:hypothetical protein
VVTRSSPGETVLKLPDLCPRDISHWQSTGDQDRCCHGRSSCKSRPLNPLLVNCLLDGEAYDSSTRYRVERERRARASVRYLR